MSDKYRKLHVQLLAITPRSILVTGLGEDPAAGGKWIGRSLLSYICDESVNSYRGALPADTFPLEAMDWVLRKEGIT